MQYTGSLTTNDIIVNEFFVNTSDPVIQGKLNDKSDPLTKQLTSLFEAEVIISYILFSYFCNI